jgi:hypothetical protein
MEAPAIATRKRASIASGCSWTVCRKTIPAPADTNARVNPRSTRSLCLNISGTRSLDFPYERFVAPHCPKLAIRIARKPASAQSKIFTERDFRTRELPVMTRSFLFGARTGWALPNGLSCDRKRKNSPPDEEGTASAKRGRGGQNTNNFSNQEMFQLYDLPALTSFGRPLLVRRGPVGQSGRGGLVKKFLEHTTTSTRKLALATRACTFSSCSGQILMTAPPRYPTTMFRQ